MLACVQNLAQIECKVFSVDLFRFLDQHLAVTDDGVQRCTQLVAHVGQKYALGLIGGFSRCACFSQFLLPDFGLVKLFGQSLPQLLFRCRFFFYLLQNFVQFDELLDHELGGDFRRLLSDQHFFVELGVFYDEFQPGAFSAFRLVLVHLCIH